LTSGTRPWNINHLAERVAIADARKGIVDSCRPLVAAIEIRKLLSLMKASYSPVLTNPFDAISCTTCVDTSAFTAIVALLSAVHGINLQVDAVVLE